MSRRDIIVSGLVLLFVVSFFVSFFVSLKVIVMGMLILATLTYGSIQQKIHLFKERKHLWFMLAFSIWLIISFFLSDNREDGLRSLQLRLPLLLFPFSIGIIQLTKELRDKILLGIAIIVSVSCFFSLGWSIYRSVQENNSAWLYNDSLSFLIGQQSIYTSLLVNISIYIFTYHLFYSPHSRGHKLWLALGICFLFIVSYLLASRNMMLILYISAFFFSFYFILTKKKYLEGAILLMGMIIIGFLVFKFFPKTINRFRELAYTQFNFQSQAKESHYAGELTPDQWNGANFRLAAWQCGWQLFKEHPVRGVDLGDKNDELLRVYTQKKFQFAIATRKNVHNNYLDILFSMGVAGLFLFLTAWILLPLFQMARYRDSLAFLITLTFALAMLTENYFDRSIGGLLFGFFVPFLLTTPNRSKKRF